MELTLSTWDHDRVMAIHDGRVFVPGVTLNCQVHPTSKLFPWAVQEARFDITEMSVSSYILQLSRGGSDYTAIPAFVSRAFRHSGFFARAGSGINSPADFAGRRIGVPEYQMTAAVWMRGILHDEYGVDCDAIHWRTGALDEGVRVERLPLELPPGMQVEPIKKGDTLQELLLRGEIDGLLAPKPPRAFLEGHPDLVRLFPDFEAAEQAYHQKTGLFPIMHLIGLRKSIADDYPDLTRSLYDAFLTARDIGVGSDARSLAGQFQPSVAALVERLDGADIGDTRPRHLALWFRRQPGRNRRDLPLFGPATSGCQPGCARGAVSSLVVGDLT